MILKYLKSISSLSFIFLIIDFLLLITGHNPAGDYVFIWMIILSIILNIEGHLNTYYKAILLFILMLPVIFIKGNTDKLLVLAVFSVVFYFYRVNKNKFSYAETAEEFKKSFYVILGILIISGLYLEKALTARYLLPYMMFYIVITVPYLRYLRNYEYNAVNEKLNKINFLYFIIITASAVVFSLKTVRQQIISLFLFIYRSIMDVLLYIMSAIFVVMYNLFSKIHFKKINPDIFKINEKNQKLIKPSEAENAFYHPLFLKIIVIIFNAALIIAAFYLIRRILRKKYKAVPLTDKFEETREFIFNEKTSAGKKRGLFIFGDYYLQIKYYYRKFMKDALSKGVDIKSSDTSMDIFMKSREAYDIKSLWDMRNIYINIRYGDKTCTKDKVKEFRSLYKNRNIRR